MKNPWLQIPPEEYENHMLDVGQAQVLNTLLKQKLEQYTPFSFALLGCSSGNGLEHVHPSVTKHVYAIDINPEYIKKTKENFAYLGETLKCSIIDIQKDKLPFRNSDLIFAGLILEYVEPKTVLEKLVKSLDKDGILFIVIQKNRNTPFVTKTKYSSLKNLSKISKEVDEHLIYKILSSFSMSLYARHEILLNENKSFICVEYRFIDRIPKPYR